jgi:hypothetical protein
LYGTEALGTPSRTGASSVGEITAGTIATMSPDDHDVWSDGREQTRAEVREIFARHATSREAPASSLDPVERRSALPGFLSLPARGWRGLSAAGKAAVLVLAAALVALAAVLLPPAVENAQQNVVNERRAIAANRERMRRELVREQRPQRAVLPAALPLAQGLAARVDADARRRVAAGRLEGPVGPTTCERITRTGEDPRYATFTCLVEQGDRGVYRGRDVRSGYRFRGRVQLDARRAAWCKENPPPLHADQEEFVRVQLSRACTG